jgi:hypothetical protein
MFEFLPNPKSKKPPGLSIPTLRQKPGESVGHPESLFEVFTKE